MRLFLESEASSFAARFEVAAERITEELGTLESSLDASIRNMSEQLGWADYQLGDTESALDTIEAMVGKLSKETGDVTTRLRTLFRQDKREDPIRERERLRYVNNLVKDISENEALMKHLSSGGELTLKSSESGNPDILDEDVKELLEVAVKYLRDKEEERRYGISVKALKECTEADLDQFASKVVDGGEVADGVRDRVERAHRLGVITYDGSVVGTAALKKPAVGYRSKVFRKAKSTLDATGYPYELGWIYLDVAHRKKGQMTRLLNELLPAAKGAALFATTRVTNEVMQDMLGQLKFAREGEDYPSEREGAEPLQLFVRGPQPAKAS